MVSFNTSKIIHVASSIQCFTLVQRQRMKVGSDAKDQGQPRIKWFFFYWLGSKWSLYGFSSFYVSFMCSIFCEHNAYLYMFKFFWLMKFEKKNNSKKKHGHTRHKKKV